MGKAFGDRAVEASNREDVRPPGATAPQDPLLGQVVDGRYRLEKRLARGAMGRVYVARQVALDRQVALKILDPKSAGDDLAVFEERFQLEASTLARLQHGNTVRVIDYGRWRRHTYLVMEFVDGYSLRRLAAAGAVPAARMLHIATQLCDALQEAHALGLIHRDLKPDNVLITRHAGALDVVKVVDFGLAKDFQATAEVTQVGQVMGTPMYMAPEQIRDEGCDQRTDIYALGVLLYRGLTGTSPFEKGPAMKVLTAHLREAPQPFAKANPDVELPPCLESVVMRCLEKDPAQRYANVAELRRALNASKLALTHREVWDATIGFDDGAAVLPDSIEERATGMSLRVAGLPAGAVVPAHSAESGGVLPMRLVPLVLALAGFIGAVAGAVLGRLVVL